MNDFKYEIWVRDKIIAVFKHKADFIVAVEALESTFPNCKFVTVDKT